MNNSKKALVATTVASTIDQFCMRNIHMLQELGFQVEVAANFQQGSTTSDSRLREFRKELSDMGVTIHDVGFERSVTSLNNLRAYRQICKIVRSGGYQLIHCHTPVGAMLVRLAARKERKKGTKVIYTAHGFHFFQGAPKKNWMLYYLVEKFCSRFTDVIITMNQEDFDLARKKMHRAAIYCVHGVGVDTNRFFSDYGDREKLRNELGLSPDDRLVLSIGELIPRKNHEASIRAMQKVENHQAMLWIAGKGPLQGQLEELIHSLGLNDRVSLLGYRSDIPKLCRAADIFCFPTYQEGLSVALMEVMASGLPCVVSDIRGNRDLIEDGKGGFLCGCKDIEQIAQNLKRLLGNDDLRGRMGRYNQEAIKAFDYTQVDKEMEAIYHTAIGYKSGKEAGE